MLARIDPEADGIVNRTADSDMILVTVVTMLPNLCNVRVVFPSTSFTRDLSTDLLASTVWYAFAISVSNG